MQREERHVAILAVRTGTWHRHIADCIIFVALQRRYLLESINVYVDNAKGVLTMATLVAIKFPTTEGAQTMLYTLENLQKQQLIQIEDGAIVTWPEGASKPKTKQLT